MNNGSQFILCRWVVSATVIAGFIASSSAQIISNGSFEAEPAGTSVNITTTEIVDSSTFTDWRFFSTGSPPKDF